MDFLDILGLTLSFLGIYSLILSPRYLIPCYFIPFLSVHLNEAQELLSRAEEISAIPPESEHRTDLGLLANRFAELRTESNNARGAFQQLRLAIQHRLTWRLYVLYYRIEGMKLNLELAIDEQQLRIAESATRTVAPIPAAVATATPVHIVVEPTLPLPSYSP